MECSDFFYELPAELIAQYPSEKRGDSRLLSLDGNTGETEDLQFEHLPSLINANDLLIFNNTRVIPARLSGEKATGGKIEILLERLLGEGRFLAQIRASKSPKTDSTIHLQDGSVVNIVEKRDGFYLCQAGSEKQLHDSLNEVGQLPLPPYIKRQANDNDRERYQTLFARHEGAVAAPTAGLHFSQAMLKRIKQADINSAYITLHIGAGTFQPVRAKNIEQHRMHHEQYVISEDVCRAIMETRECGGRIIAVGTTTVRALETAIRDKGLIPQKGETDIFIYPGFDFQLVDALLTNFHLPESTLLMLVSAFAGRDNVLNAYQHAVKEQYRFFSYGDAMFITKNRVTDEI